MKKMEEPVTLMDAKESALHSVRDHTGKTKGSYVAGPVPVLRVVRTRREEMKDVEHLLSVWTADQTRKQSEAAFLRIKRRSSRYVNTLR